VAVGFLHMLAMKISLQTCFILYGALTGCVTCDPVVIDEEADLDPLNTETTGPDHSCSHQMMKPEFLRYTINQVKQMQMNWDPFPHFHLTEAFHPELYECLVRALPKHTHAYKPLASPKDKVPEGQRRRHSIVLLDEQGSQGKVVVGPLRKSVTRAQKRKFLGTFEHIPSSSADVNVPFWRAWATLFDSQELKMAYLDKFASTVSARLRGSNTTLDTIGNQTRWEVSLTRDVDGYWIGPHVDGHRKWITTIYYLAKNGEGDAKSGTYVLEEDGASYPGESDVGWEGYKIREQVPFIPNSAFVFSPCKSSWHAVPEFRTQGSTQRDTIQAFIKSTATFERVDQKECPSDASDR